MSSRQEVACK